MISTPEKLASLLQTPDRRRRVLFSALLANETSLDTQPSDRVDGEWLAKAQRELFEGYDFLNFIKQEYPKRVTFFGSARNNLDPAMYKDAERMEERLARDGVAVISGGNSGIMNAVAKGAHESGGVSIGFGADIPGEPPSPFLSHSIRFQNLFVRQELLIRSGNAYVFYPGGFGTLYEFSHIMTLMQLAKVEKVPLIVIGNGYWSEFKKWVHEHMSRNNGTIDPADLELFTVVENDEEAYRILNDWFSN